MKAGVSVPFFVLTSIDHYITFLNRVWDESPSVSS